MFTLIPQDVEAYIEQVEKDRRPKQNLQDQKWNMAIDEDFLNELIRHDFKSTKKGRGYTSLLVLKKPKAVVQQRDDRDHHDQQIPSNQAEVLRPPPMVMDMKRWHDQLTSKQRAAYQRGLEADRAEADSMRSKKSHLSNGF